MINFYNQVPSVYTSASRDFQYLSWLINIVLNYVKHNVDSLYNLPATSANPKLTELLAATLGFKVKRNYDQKQLAALVAVLPIIIRYKGTKTAVDTAGNAMIAAVGSSGTFLSTFSDGVLEVCLPEKLIDVTLFTDLLPYIVPAGITCRILNTNIVSKGYTTEVRYSDKLTAEFYPDITWDSKSHAITGISAMYEEPGANFVNAEPSFANYFTDGDTNTLNIGLLDNNIIPTLDEAVADPDSNYEAITASSGDTDTEE